MGTLPPHPLESYMLDAINQATFTSLAECPSDWQDTDLLHSHTSLCNLLEEHQHNHFQLLEVYVDDIIGVIHITDLEALQQSFSALLHGIHLVFSSNPIGTTATTSFQLQNWLLAMECGSISKRYL